MNKRDQPAVCANARVKVDELEALRFQSAQLALQIAHFQRQVVHSLTTRLQKTRHSRLLGNGRQQFEKARSRSERCDADALIVEIGLNWRGETERTIVSYGRSQIANHDADVMKIEPSKRQLINHLCSTTRTGAASHRDIGHQVITAIGSREIDLQLVGVDIKMA